MLKSFLLGPTSLDYFHFQWFKQQCPNYKIVAFCLSLHPNQWVPSAKRSRESRCLLKTFFQTKVMCCQGKKLKVEIIAKYLLRFGCTHRLHTYFINRLFKENKKLWCFVDWLPRGVKKKALPRVSSKKREIDLFWYFGCLIQVQCLGVARQDTSKSRN